jgi:F-type H+-transporting ATPase subunit delta
VRDALTDPALPPENKKKLIADTLGERANPLAVSLLGFVIELGRAREVGRIVEALAEVVAATRERAVAEVRTAMPLDETQATKLAAALSKAAGRPIEIRVIVDPDVLGGVVARVGDEIFDGSVRTRLQEAREQLTGTTTRSG